MTATQSREVLMAPLNMFVISIAIISIAPLSCVCLLYWLYCNVELSDVLISCCQYVKLYRGIQTLLVLPRPMTVKTMRLTKALYQVQHSITHEVNVNHCCPHVT